MTLKMWPLDLPAQEVLKLSGEAVIPWAVFDPAWYLATYPQAASFATDGDPSSLPGQVSFWRERSSRTLRVE